MTPLWTAAAAAAATGGEAVGWDAVTGVAIDTRELAPGDLFVALRGENRDGHAFVADALAGGAGACLVTHRPEGVAADAPLLVTDDTLDALRALGAAARARAGARIIGVTGSVGKTSTKDMLRAMLEGQGRTHAAARSFNNHWGVPLTLARMPADAEYAVLEIGMNRANEIAPLSRLARPHVALITTVEAAHLETLGTIEAVADAKAEIFVGLEPDGVAVLNADNAHFARLSAAAGGRRIIPFGRAAEEFRLLDARPAGSATVITAEARGTPVAFKLATPGAHFAANALGALAAADAAGADLARAALALGTWSPAPGRGARVTVELGPAGTDGAITLLDDSYNANPTAVAAALAVLAQAETDGGRGARGARGRRIALLGDMLELGPVENALHAELADLPEIAEVDRIHCCGPRMRHLHEALPARRRGIWTKDSDDLAEAAATLVDAGDTVMVKGSRGAKMSVVVDAIKRLGVVAAQDADGSA